MINRQELRETLTEENIIHLMKLLGCSEFKDNNTYIQFKTICHNIDENTAGFNLSYYKNTHRFYCFSSCYTMDIFTLIKKRWQLVNSEEDVSFNNIAYWVMNHCDINLDNNEPMVDYQSPLNPNDYKNKTIEVILPEKNKNVLDTFSNYHCVEWLNDNISDEAMNKYNIKYSISRNAVIIPHYDVHNRLIGIRRRALNPEEQDDKYKPIFIENVSYSHPLSYNLYGLNLVKDEVKHRKTIIIAEGEKASLQGYTMWGKDNIVVSSCGNKINRWQVFLIMKYCCPNEIIIAFDKGLDFNKVESMCKKYLYYCNFSYTYDHSNELRDKESPLDRPDLIEKLLKTRVRVR